MPARIQRRRTPGWRGKDLACTCPLPEHGKLDHCHAAVLLAAAITTEETVRV